MNSITNQIDNIKQILSMPSSQISQQRFPFSTFLMGALYIKSPNINRIKDFVEILENLSINKKITLKDEIAILNSVYDNIDSIDKIESSILEKIDMGENVKIETQLKKIQQNLPEQEQIQKTNSLNSSQNTIQIEDNIQFEPKKEEMLLQALKAEQERKSLQLIKKIQQQQTSNKMNQDGAQCQICLDSLYSADFLLFDKCNHIFHINCLKESYKNSISERKFPLVCPTEGCGSAVGDLELRQILDNKSYEQYIQLTFKNYVDLNNDSVSWCPTADCKYVFFFNDDNQVQFQCLQCKKQYCLKCRSDWHKNMTCKQYQITNTFNDDDQKFLNFVKGAKFKQCPKCKFWVEKNMGCDHMSCRCGNQFCYKCGGKYGDCECVREARQKQKQLIELQQARMRKRQQNKQKKMQKLLQKQNKTKVVQVQTKTRRSTRKR